MIPKISFSENSIPHVTSQSYPADNPVTAIGKGLLNPSGSDQTISKTKQFFSTLVTAKLENSVKFIEQYDINSAFPSDLWDFADNFPSAKIPYKELEGSYINSNYYIDHDDLTRFKDNVQNSILNLLELAETPQVKAHGPLSGICSQIIDQLIQIQYLSEACEGMDPLPSEMFSSLKLPNRLTTQLGIELRKIERDRLLEFLGHLAALTLNKQDSKTQKLIDLVYKFFGYTDEKGSLDPKTKSQKITMGLEKLRDYINLRSPRQRRDMKAGRTGVAEFIYQFCLKTLLFEDKEKLLNLMTGQNDACCEQIDVAAARNIGGYHFVFDVLTDKGIATLDSIGTRKTLGSNLASNYDNLILSKSFYDSCKPLHLDNINVPVQKDNNCYLSAGWLKFCTFLHFFEQVIK